MLVCTIWDIAPWLESMEVGSFSRLWLPFSMRVGEGRLLTAGCAKDYGQGALLVQATASRWDPALLAANYLKDFYDKNILGTSFSKRSDLLSLWLFGQRGRQRTPKVNSQPFVSRHSVDMEQGLPPVIARILCRVYNCT